MIRTLLSGMLLTGALVSAKDNYEIRTWKKIQVTDKFYSEGAAFADFNKDGQNDVVSGPFWYEGPDFKKSHEIYPAVAVDPHGYSKNFLAYTYDFNKDGWPDVLVVGFPGEDTSWYENPKGKEGNWVKHLGLDVTDNESPMFADINGDGQPDLICNSRGFFGYATFDIKEPNKAWTFHRISTDGKYHKFTHGIGIGDVNGDKKMDLLEATGWWEQPAALKGDPTWVKHEFKFSEPGGAQMYAFDVDGDGDNDVITCLYAHGFGLVWYEQVKTNGQIDFKRHIIINKQDSDSKYGIHFSQMHGIDVFDIDGDGLKDIVTGKRYWAHGPTGDEEAGAPAVVYYFKLVRNKDKSVDWIPFMVDDNSGVGTQVMAGFINKDKRADIVVGNKKGTFVHLQEVKKVSKEEWEKAQPRAVNGKP